MNSFYSGPSGRSFEIKAIFTSKNGLTDSLSHDLSQGWTSSVGVGEFVIVSYGMPNDANYDIYRQRDLDVEGKSYNSTLWVKTYDESAGNASGLNYELVSSMTGNTPKIQFDLPSGVLDAGDEPYVTCDVSNQDEPVIKFYLPRSQVLKMLDRVTLNADETPEVIYNDSDINHPTLQFKLPQSQVIGDVEVTSVPVDQQPKVTLDTIDNGTINRPVIKFELPVSQQLLDKNVSRVVLDADEAPYIKFDAVTNPNEPTLVFYLPQSQVMQDPDKVVLDPEENPDVADIGDVNNPKLQFSLPRAVKFYYGTLLGTKDGQALNAESGTYVETNEAFASYGVGDYYINAPTGFIYKVVNKSGNTCTFAYQACVQSPLPTAKASSIAPYVLDGSDYVSAVPQVERTIKQDGAEWELEFKLPQAPKPAITTAFVGAADIGAAQVDITANDTVTFDFKIPTGSRLFAGLEVTSSGTVVTVTGAKNGDIYLNSDTGVVYTLTDGVWQASEKSLKGPVGETLNIVASYVIKEADGYSNTANSIGSYIDSNYTDTIDSHCLFAITYIELADEISTAYWYFKVDNKWNFVQLTGGTAGLIESEYQAEADGDVTNKAYSVHYVNTLIEGTEDETGKLTTYSKAKIEELLSQLDETLNTWGSFGDLGDEKATDQDDLDKIKRDKDKLFS